MKKEKHTPRKTNEFALKINGWKMYSYWNSPFLEGTC